MPKKAGARQNGLGGIAYLGKGRKKPYAARLTVWQPDGTQGYKYIGYYTDRTEAAKALAKALYEPVADKASITLGELRDEWKAYYYRFIEKQTQDNYNAAWNYISPLQKTKVKELRTAQLQKIIDSCDKSRSTKEKIKAFCHLIFKYAMENDIVNKNYAEFLRLEKSVKEEKEVFTDLELKKLEENAPKVAGAECVLMMIYTGFRISEFLELSCMNVDLTALTMTGGLKTDAGRGRVIPISPEILNYVIARHTLSDAPFIRDDKGNSYTAKRFRESVYYPALESCGISKKVPHCTRHTFASMLDRKKVPAAEIQRLMGHTSYDFTAETYVHKNITDLEKAVSTL
jgi:integrase